MKYQNYSPLDFVKDETFQKWVKTPDEKLNFYWESWMQNHKDRKHLVMEAREILLSINFPAARASQVEIDDIFEKVIRDERPISLRKIDEKGERRSLYLKKVIAVAASVLLLTSFGFVFYQLKLKSVAHQETSIQYEKIKENPTGRKSTIHLTDGSVIKLNASSKLRISDDFGLHKREVYLEGEAFFEISKDPQKPFIVHTGNISTRVTGTAFNVNAYRENGSIKVAVYEGSVSTILHNDNGNDTLKLQPSDMAVYEKADNKLFKTDYDYTETLGWKDGIIYFKDANSKDIFNYLENWYGVEIYAKDQDRIMGSFYGEFKNENLENVLTAMAKALRFEYQINDDNKVFIKPQKNENQ